MTMDLGYGRGWAADDAARSIFRIDSQLGRPADINEAGRSAEDADANYAAWINYQNGGPWAPRALPASESVHCRGEAADSDDWRDDSAASVWQANGWVRTASDEWWHAEYFPDRDQHINDPVSIPASSATPIPSEEDDMLALRIKDGAGRSHLAALGVGVFRHFIEGDNPEWIKNVIRADDAWVDVPLPQLPALLRTYGCDLQIWDVRDSAFVVLDPLDNTVRSGNMWSAANAARAKLTPIQVNSTETLAYVKEIAGKA